MDAIGRHKQRSRGVWYGSSEKKACFGDAGMPYWEDLTGEDTVFDWFGSIRPLTLGEESGILIIK